MSSQLMKLVRDNIVEQPNMQIQLCVNDQVFRTMLLAKVVEESKELIMANSRENAVEELADLAEVIEAFMSHAGITSEELLLVKTNKRMLKGGFELRKLAIIGKVDI